MKKAEQTPHPVQTLLSFAEWRWGSRFNDDGKQLWWCDEDLEPNYLVVTNGVEHYVETEVGILKADIREDGTLVAVGVAIVRAQ